ncbi:MAG: fibronectin type III domain-containing protein, partial [Candidatus ainarchaeum sp.]|nr:fibronectin type III domain-containing protein [Candidatus ainarchaeum sp.]
MPAIAETRWAIYLAALLFLASFALATLSITFIPPTPDNASTIIVPNATINVSVGENATSCLLAISGGTGGALWSNIKHLGISGGAFDYNASLGVNNYSSFTMNQLLPLDASSYHACYLRSNGNSTCYGANWNSQSTPYTGGDAIALAAGDAHTCYLRSNGNSFCYGSNSSGRSTGYSGGNAIAVAAGSYHTCYLLSTGNSLCYGYNYSGSTNAYSGGNAIAVSAGNYHTCYLLSSGNSTCYGYYYYANYGQDTAYSGGDAIAVSAGYVHTCYLLSSGNSFCYGNNGSGRSTGYSGGDAIALSAGSYHTCYLLSSGNSFCYGSNSSGESTGYSGGDAIGVSAGNYYTCYLVSNGSSACLGQPSYYYDYGQADPYTGTDLRIPFAASPGRVMEVHNNDTSTTANYSLADLVEGNYSYNVTCANSTPSSNTSGNQAFTVELKLLFSNVVNQTQPDETSIMINWTTDKSSNSTASYSTVDGPVTLATDASYSTSHSITLTGLTQNVTYYYNLTSCNPAGLCNTSGPYRAIADITPPSIELVDPTPPDVAIVRDQPFINSTVNENVSECVLFLGDPDQTWANIRHLGVMGGRFDYGASMGVNNYSSLTMQHRLPIAAYEHTCYLLANGSSTCYGNNDYGEADPYTGGDAIAVAAEEYHTCYLRSNGNSACHGANWGGQSTSYTGGDAIAVAVGQYHTCYLLSTGNSLCYGDDSYGQSDPYTGGDAIAVAAGRYRTCYLLSTGNSACYGNNDYGQSTSYTGGNAIALSVSGSHTCYLLSTGNSFCYGLNNNGQAIAYTGGDAIALSASNDHTCYLLSNGTSTCYGTNTYGESTDYTGGDAIGVASGGAHTCYLLSSGNSVCYGYNDDGRSTNYTGGDLKIPFAFPSYAMETSNLDASTTANYTFVGMPDDNYSIYAGCHDLAGNWNVSANRSFMLETHVSISGVVNRTQPDETSAMINWTTDKSANSTVNYGETPAYGMSAGDASYSASHSITLTGLTPGTLYYYSVRSCTPTGLCNDSEQYQFIADATPPSMNFTDPTPADGSVISYQNAVINITVSKNVSQCLLYLYDPAKLWSNLRHLGLNGGTYDYNASAGVNNYSSFNMQNRMPLGTGSPQMCYLLSNGNSACYGSNNEGERVNHIGHNAVAISAAIQLTCYLLSTGNSVCYGDNGSGQATAYTGGDAIALAAGWHHTCYLLSTGNSTCYGDDSYGQATAYTGGDAIAVAVGEYHTCYLLSSGNSFCYGNDDNGQSTSHAGGDAIMISAGNDYTCYLLSTGNSTCYGSNADSRATNYTGGDAIAVSAQFTHTCYLLRNGNSKCYGTNSDGESTDYSGGDAIGVGSGAAHTCYLRSNGNSICYGYNSDGRANPYNNSDLMLPFAMITYPMAADNADASTTANATLPDLSDGDYLAYANCTDYVGNVNVSETRAFTLAMNLLITGVVNRSQPGDTSAQINWTTSAPANSTVNYGETPGLGTLVEDGSYSTHHVINLTGLTPLALYYYNVTSCTVTDICSTTGPYQFISDGTAPSMNFTDPTPADGSTTSTSSATINMTLSENVSSCLLAFNKQGALWTNVKHLNLLWGAFDYNASIGASNYTSFSMQHRLPIGMGSYHTCYLRSNGNSSCYGSSGWNENTPYTAGDLVEISGGNQFNCYLNAAGNSLCYGVGYSGQTTSYTGGDAVALAAGGSHTCYLLNTGNSTCYGDSGNGRTTSYTGGDAIAVTAGDYHTCYLLSSGNSFCYGYNYSGSTTGYSGGDAIAVAAGAYHTCYLLSTGNSVCYGYNSSGQTTGYSGGNAISVVASYYHTCYLLSTGNSVCYGQNSYGEADPYTGGDAIGMKTSSYVTCYVLSNGNSTCYGNGDPAIPYTGGDLKIPFSPAIYEMVVDNADSYTTANYTISPLAEGTYGFYANCTDFAGNSNLSETRSFDMSLSITISNVANKTQPGDTSEQINWTTSGSGNSTVNYGETPDLGSLITDASYSIHHVMNLTGLTPGMHYYYNLSSCTSTDICNTSGTYQFIADATPPSINFTDPTPANASLVNYQNAIINATLSENVTQCVLYMYDQSKTWSNLKHLGINWGRLDYNASVGVNNYSSITMQYLSPVVAGNYHTCYVLSNGNSACYGANYYGQSNNYTGGNAVAGAAGEYHTCYLLSNGNSTCYGYNDYGQRTAYTGGNAIAVSAAYRHTCYLLSTGNSACYGNNGSGQATGYSGGDAIGLAAGNYHTCYLLSNGNSTCYGYNYAGSRNSYTGGDAIAVAAGEYHTCYLLSNGNSACYGDNGNGQSIAYAGGNAIAVAAEDDHTCYLLSSGNSVCYGANSSGSDMPYSGGNAISVSIGDSHTCYLLSNGNSACHGYNDDGRSTNYSTGNLRAPFAPPSYQMVVNNSGSYTTANHTLPELPVGS